MGHPPPGIDTPSPGQGHPNWDLPKQGPPPSGRETPLHPRRDAPPPGRDPLDMTPPNRDTRSPPGAGAPPASLGTRAGTSLSMGTPKQPWAAPPPHHGHTRTPRNTPGHPGTGTLGPSEHGPPPPWVTPAHGHPQHPGVPLGTQAGPSPPVPHRGCPSGLTWGARCQAGGMSGRRRSSTAKRRSWAPVGLAPNSASYASRNAGTGAPAGRDGGGQRGWVGGGGCSQGSRGGHPWVLTGAEGLAA